MKALNKNWIGVFLVLVCACAKAEELAPFSISGISSGAFLATQMGAIFSDKISGVASVAGGFYFCAQNQMQKALENSRVINLNYLSMFQTTINRDYKVTDNLKNIIQLSPHNPIYQSVGICMQNPQKSELQIETMKQNEKSGLIADMNNIKQQKILIFNGKNDSVVQFPMLAKLLEYYQTLAVPTENIKTIEGSGGHNWPTDRGDQKNCNNQSVPYISSCDLNITEEIIRQVTPIKNPNRYHEPESTPIEQQENIALIHKVGQLLPKQLNITKPISIARYGYMAANTECLNNPTDCHIHVALHGCEMSDSFNSDFDKEYQKYTQQGFLLMRNKSEAFPFSPLPIIEQKTNKYGLLRFVLASGFLDYVKNNKLIVLFPQTWITTENYPLNPKGCWDWFGWTGKEYATNQGVEANWLIHWIDSIRQNPQKFIIKGDLKLKEAQSL